MNTTEEPALKRILTTVCQPCLDGKGDECHTPGCALFLHSVDLPWTEGLYEIIQDDTRATDRDAELAAMREALNFTAETLKRIREYIADGQLATDADLQDLCVSNAQKTEGFIQSALASTAGTELLERLRLAVEERDQARIERDTEQQFRQRSDTKLAAVTAERDRAKAAALDSDRAHDARVSECERQADRIQELQAKLAAAESESAGLRKELDELQEMLRQIPNT